MASRVDTLIGRRPLLEGLSRLCHVIGTRLVTIKGPGGVGKTAVVRSFCEDAPADLPALFVSLEGALELRHVHDELRRALAVPDALDEPVSAAVARALAARGPCILVLDHFEQLLPDGAALLEALLDAAPDARVVVTSRVVTGVFQEILLEVPHLSDEDARALLEQRSGRPVRAAESATILPHLGGLPLAIELAAARLRVLPAGLLGDALVEDLRVLDGHDPGDGERRRAQGLFASLEASVALLGPDVRRAFFAAAGFPTPFDARALAGVLQISLAPAVMLLEALRGASLLRAEPDATFVVPMPQRALATPAMCGLSAEEADAFERQREVYALAEARAGRVLPRLLEGVVQHGVSAEQIVAAAASLRWQESDAATLRTTIARVSAAARSAPGLNAERALIVLADACWRLGALDDGARLLDELDAVRGASAEDAGARARHAAEAALVRARVAFARGQLDDAAAAAQRAVDDALTDPLVRARAVQVLGGVAQARGDRANAERLLCDARAQARAQGAVDLEAHVEASLGTLALDAGELEQAQTRLANAAHLAARAKQGRTHDVALAYGALAAAELGDLARAQLLIDQAIAGGLRSGHLLHVGVFQAYGAVIAALRDAVDEAIERLTLATVDEPAWREVRELCAAFVDCARARAARARADAPDAEREDAQARARVERAAGHAAGSDDVRVLLRLFSGFVARIAVAPSPASRTTIKLGPGGSFVAVDDADPFPLNRRPVLRALVTTLVDAHEKTPGRGVTLRDLAAAAWPDERFAAAIHRNRLHVALTSLRENGLRDVIVRGSDGYVLAPGTRVTHAER